MWKMGNQRAEESVMHFLQYCDLNSGPTPRDTPSVLFYCVRYFPDGVSQTICLGCLPEYLGLQV
jgi:hypothetical protein